MTGILAGCQGMRRRQPVLDYSVQNRKGQLGQGTGSPVPALGLAGLSVTQICSASSRVIYSSVHSMIIC